MEFHADLPDTQYFIRAIGENGIRVQDEYYRGPFIISGRGIIPSWDVLSVDEIDESRLQVIFELQPEVVLLGTGRRQLFLPAATQVHFFRRGVGFEVMTTDAACRTFNVLVAEGRHVVAALLPLTP